LHSHPSIFPSRHSHSSSLSSSLTQQLPHSSYTAAGREPSSKPPCRRAPPRTLASLPWPALCSLRSVSLQQDAPLPRRAEAAPMAPISSSLSLLSMASSRAPSLFSSWRELPAPCSTANRGQRRPSSPIAWSSGFPLPARPRHRAGKSQRPAVAHPMDGAQKIPAGAPSFSPARSPSRSSSSPHLPSLRSSSAKRRCPAAPTHPPASSLLPLRACQVLGIMSRETCCCSTL
jgi:hypothetical protein